MFCFWQLSYFNRTTKFLPNFSTLQDTKIIGYVYNGVVDNFTMFHSGYTSLFLKTTVKTVTSFFSCILWVNLSWCRSIMFCVHVEVIVVEASISSKHCILILNVLAWRIRHVESKYSYYIKKGWKKKISYQRRDYEAVADAPQSKTI